MVFMKQQSFIIYDVTVMVTLVTKAMPDAGYALKLHV